MSNIHSERQKYANTKILKHTNTNITKSKVLSGHSFIGLPYFIHTPYTQDSWLAITTIEIGFDLTPQKALVNTGN